MTVINNYVVSRHETTRETDWVHILDKFWMNKENITRAGFEPATLRIHVPVLYQLS